VVRAAALLAGTFLLCAACGVKGPPRAPRRAVTAAPAAEPSPPPIFAPDAGCAGPCPEAP